MGKASFTGLGFGILLVLAGPVAAGAETLIKIAGSTTVLPIASWAAEQWSARDDAPKIAINAGGSGVGIQSVGTGRVEIGLASRAMTPEEQKRFASVDLQVHTVGRDAVACVVSSEVYQAGVRVLSRHQIRDIYLGKITNWKELGGPDRKIVPIDKEHHRGTRHVFMQYVFGNPKARAPGARLVTGSNNEEQAKIAQSDAAIGMLSFAWTNEDVVAITLREDGREIAPTLENVRSGEFPIARDLNLITRGKTSQEVRRFIDYLLGPEGQSIVEKYGYVPLAQVYFTHSLKQTLVHDQIVHSRLAR
jgi:phosphate transport system substrate-binding protein